MDKIAPVWIDSITGDVCALVYDRALSFNNHYPLALVLYTYGYGYVEALPEEEGWPDNCISDSRLCMLINEELRILVEDNGPGSFRRLPAPKTFEFGVAIPL
jgi:hypothetical protein